MKKLIVLSFVFSFLLFGTGAVNPAAYAAEELKIGVILPLSGPLANIGTMCRRGMDFAVKGVNSEGGIKSMGGAKIKLLYSDSRGDPKIGLSEAEKLIVQDQVSTLMGAFQSSVTLTSSQVAERYKVPYLSVIAVADAVTERGFKYTFRISEKAEWTGRDMITFMDFMGKKTGKPVKTLGLLYENSDWGQSSAKSWKKYGKQFGLDIVIDEAYPHGTTDMTPVVLKFKKVNPDAILNASYLADEILFIRTLAEARWKPKVIISAGGGEVEQGFFEAVGDLAEYHFSIIPSSGDIHETKPWVRKLDEEFRKEYGIELSSAASLMPYACMQVMIDSLERAASSDREKIREALAKTNITSGKAMILPYERISFEADGQNHNAPLVICQIQKRKLRAVYPPNVVAPGVTAVWPLPPMQ